MKHKETASPVSYFETGMMGMQHWQGAWIGEEEEFLSSPVHDTGNFLYAFFSFLLPVVGIIAAQVFKKKRYYRNYKACRKGAIIGFVLIIIILVLFLLLLLLAVI